MRKIILSMLLCLSVIAAEAKTETKSFELNEAKKEWNAEKLSISGNTISYSNTSDGNAAVSWLDGTATDISGYDRLVLELEEASDNTVEVAVSNGGFWGKYYSTTLATGSTSLTVNLSGLTITSSPGENDTWKTGDAIDLTAVNMIYLRTAWCRSQTIKVKSFRLEKDITNYDQVLTKAGTTALDLSQMGEKFTYAGKPTFDASTGTLTIEGTGTNSSDINLGYGFTNLSYNVADYDRIIIKAKVGTQGWHGLCVRVEQDGLTGNYQTDAISASDGEKTITIELGESFKTNNDLGKDASGEDVKEGTQITTINSIYFWTMSVTKSVISEVALEKDGAVTYLLRENTTPKFGTVCLPFAANAPANTYIYKVAGVDSKTSPTRLYLEKVETLEAGTAYIYQSTDDQDITFVKNDEATLLETPTKATDLQGSFSTASVTSGSYILVSGRWKKATSSNKVGAYRAYLLLNGVQEKTDEQALSKAFVMSFDSATTGISHVSAETSSACYNLQGQRVTGLAKGIVIKDGKKMIVR